LPNTNSVKPFSPGLPSPFKHAVPNGSNDAGDSIGSSDGSDQGQGLAYGYDAFAPFGSADTWAGTLVDQTQVSGQPALAPPQEGGLPTNNSMLADATPVPRCDVVTTLVDGAGSKPTSLAWSTPVLVLGSVAPAQHPAVIAPAPVSNEIHTLLRASTAPALSSGLLSADAIRGGLVGINTGGDLRLSAGAPAVGGLVGYATPSIDHVLVATVVVSVDTTYNLGLLGQYAAASFTEGQSRFVGGLVGSNQGSIVSMDAGGVSGGLVAIATVSAPQPTLLTGSLVGVIQH
jgi:hypothetical protein